MDGCVGWIIGTIIGILVSAGVIHIAAFASGLADKGFSAAIVCTICLYLAGYFVIIPAMFIVGCFCPWWVVLIVVIYLIVYIVQTVYETSFGQAFMLLFVTLIVNTLYVMLFYGPRIAEVADQLNRSSASKNI
jgi:hypothetical protein